MARRPTRSRRAAPAPWWRTFTVGQRWLAAGVGVLMVGIVVWLAWPADKKTPPPRERQYLAYTACLLTDAQGISGTDAAPVWAAMQEASGTTHAKVQYLAVSGAQTLDNALPFLASLAQSGCDLVFAAGPIPVQAVQKDSGTFPKTRFVTIGGTASGAATANVSTVAVDDEHAGVVRTITEGVAAGRHD